MARNPDPNDLPETYEAAQNEGLDPEIVDVPLDDALNRGMSVPELNIDRMAPPEILNAVMKRNTIIFDEGYGRMLTKCPAYSIPAACGLRPEPGPVLETPMLVCTGPTVAKDQKTSLFGSGGSYYTVKPCHRNCPYHPDRKNELRREHIESNYPGKGWL